MVKKVRNPLAQAMGLVLQSMRDKMGGVSSSHIASSLGLAASHYRMVEAGSAILQSGRAIRIVQTFETIEFVPLCQVLVAIQILDSAKQSINDMRTISELLIEANPLLAGVLEKFDNIWDIIGSGKPIDVSRQLVSDGITKELEEFLTTEPLTFSAEQFDNFMSPTYQHPISGQLYNKIGNILQGVAPFYLDTILQLTDNLKGITPRVTAEELAKWEAGHKNRISHIIGIIRNPQIILDVEAFDYTFLWEESFESMLIIYRDQPEVKAGAIRDSISGCLREKFESERLRYQRELDTFDEIINGKLNIQCGNDKAARIDEILLYRDVPMNNLWSYIMVNGYVVPYIDNATVGAGSADLYGSSLAYDETSEKLVLIRKLCNEIGFAI